MAVETSYWMDRIRAVDEAKPRRVRLVSANGESHNLISARVALKARHGLTQDELYQLARERRQAILRANHPRNGLLTLGLLAVGIVLSVTGSALVNQAILMSGFGIAFIGALLACAMLAAMLDPPLGDLVDYMREEEMHASADQIAALSRAAQTDAELDALIAGWWKDGDAPIRKHDLALAQAFVNAKHAS